MFSCARSVAQRASRSEDGKWGKRLVTRVAFVVSKIKLGRTRWVSFFRVFVSRCLGSWFFGVQEEQERRKREDKERKKAEVRRRLEEAAKAKKGKKGFMTADRKKKLRVRYRSYPCGRNGKAVLIPKFRFFTLAPTALHHWRHRICCARRPPRNWRRNKSAALSNGSESSSSDLESRARLTISAMVITLDN